MPASSEAERDLRAAASGRRAPGGGIIPARSMRTTFSVRFGGLLRMSEVDAVPGEAARFELVVMATGAVLIHYRPLGGDR